MAKSNLAKPGYKVAVNDVNRPSLVMLMSLLVPVLLACSLAFYLLTMPLGTATTTVAVRPTITDARAGIQPNMVTPAREYGIIRSGSYQVYIPIVLHQPGCSNEDLP